MTNYVPVLVYSYLVSGVLLPLLCLVYLHLPAAWIDGAVPSVIRQSILAKSIYTHRPWEQPCVDADVNIHPKDVRGSDSVAVGNEDPPSVRPLTLPRIPDWVNLSQWWMNLAVLLTFGLASPLLQVCVSVESCCSQLVWIVAIRRLLRLHEEHASTSSGVSESASTCGEQVPSPPAASPGCEHACAEDGGGVTTSVSVVDACRRLEGWFEHVHVCSASSMLMVVVAVGLFWSIFFVDIVGDVYGPTAGGLAVLVPSVGCVSLCVGLMSWLQPKQAVVNTSESAIVGLAMNPMNSDFGGGSQAGPDPVPS